MARSLADLTLFASTVVNSSPWLQDPKMLPIPWRTIESKKRLKIGVLWHDGIVMPTPPVQRALRNTVEKLQAKGHEIVDWDPKYHAEASDLLTRFFLADGGATVRSILSQTAEPFRPEMAAYETAPVISVAEMWKLQAQRTELAKNYLDQWNSAGIDAILAPTTPYASVKNGDFRHVAYTGVYNVVDYSAVSFPCGMTADHALDGKSGHVPLTEADAEVRDLCKCCRRCALRMSADQ